MNQTPIVPQEPVPTPPAPVISASPHTRWGLILGVLLLAVVAYGATAYFSGLWPFAPAEVAISPSPTPDETAGWKTYTNAQYWFEIKYPIDGTMQEGYDYANAAPRSFTLSFSNPRGQRFELQIPYAATTKNIEDFVCSSGIEGRTCFTKYRTINGNRVVVTTFTRAEGEGASIKEKMAVLVDGGKFFQFYTGYDETLQKYTLVDLANTDVLFDQILSTFKFIEAGSTAWWKTYTNTQYGFEIKYPGNWIEATEHLPCCGQRFETGITFRNNLKYIPDNRITAVEGFDLEIYKIPPFAGDTVNTLEEIALTVGVGVKAPGDFSKCSGLTPTVIGIADYKALEIYARPDSICLDPTFVYGINMGKYFYVFTPWPEGGIAHITYDGRVEVAKFFPEFYTILSTFRFIE